VKRYLKDVETATAKSVQAEAIAALVRYGLNFALLVIFFLGFYYYLSFVLLAFAETRYFAQLLLTYLTEPVLLIFQGILSYIPNMIMLGLIAWVTMYIIKGMRVFFDAVEAGSFDMGDFEKHWVNPTFNIARVVVILIALVFAVPYIPGSDSAAFQGLTILVGAMLSLGANSVVSNMLAGLFVIYRRSTSIGDRIQIGDHIGDVVQIKLMETHLKSIKNELISIPNAQLMNSDVVNFSKKTDGSGLLLHTTVGIGYEEPPEKIEAMLIEAANRTKGIKSKPEPFVLWTALADYAINYQINGYTTRGSIIPKIRSDLHRNIVAVFNENNVQIMTPSYIADPPEPKIPPGEWDGHLAHHDEEPDS
jgi:small-conductance mechanosensitive channel